MRKCFAFPVYVFLLSAIAAFAAGPKADHDAKAQAALIDAERAWTDTYKSRDHKAMQELAADDFVFTDEQGAYLHNADYIKSVDDVQVQGYTMTDLQAFIYGNSGVVTGLWTGKHTVGGKDSSGSSRFTDTFVKHDGRWYIVASHDSRVP